MSDLSYLFGASTDKMQDHKRMRSSITHFDPTPVKRPRNENVKRASDTTGTRILPRDIEKMKVDEMKTHLQSLSQPIYGSKAHLQERLHAALHHASNTEDATKPMKITTVARNSERSKSCHNKDFKRQNPLAMQNVTAKAYGKQIDDATWCSVTEHRHLRMKGQFNDGSIQMQDLQNSAQDQDVHSFKFKETNMGKSLLEVKPFGCKTIERAISLPFKCIRNNTDEEKIYVDFSVQGVAVWQERVPLFIFFVHKNTDICVMDGTNYVTSRDEHQILFKADVWLPRGKISTQKQDVVLYRDYCKRFDKMSFNDRSELLVIAVYGKSLRSLYGTLPAGTNSGVGLAYSRVVSQDEGMSMLFDSQGFFDPMYASILTVPRDVDTEDFATNFYEGRQSIVYPSTHAVEFKSCVVTFAHNAKLPPVSVLATYSYDQPFMHSIEFPQGEGTLVCGVQKSTIAAITDADISSMNIFLDHEYGFDDLANPLEITSTSSTKDFKENYIDDDEDKAMSWLLDSPK